MVAIYYYLEWNLEWQTKLVNYKKNAIMLQADKDYITSYGKYMLQPYQSEYYQSLKNDFTYEKERIIATI